MTISTKKPLYAEVHNVPDDYEFTDEELNRIIAGDMFTPRQDAIMAREIQKLRAAMLHGAEPVSQTYKSQHTQFEQVADLYEMQFDDGRTCAFHTDAQKAAQWLQACDGNRVQEYVKLERLRNALSGNSPGTPDSWISCSDRMPDDGQHVIILCDGAFVLYAQYRDGEFFDVVRNGDEFFETQSRNVTDWMPLPEPPQEVRQ
ncbi:DUF551 domain-containing protein [Escherichia coli]|nr:DUF551 domain-containing protein [Escherichia coli]EEV0662770.1 DUF551 domain-containing protein [Escherichia coli]EIZ8706181.1 DUF551 domain-containing protein [Escherichia coli]EJR8255265.1 DUF551 domain-containing protein [Escherichia coli]